MRRSHYFLPTLRENPAEAQVVSHRLMLRTGMIRQVASGIYNWLPFGLRTLRKAEAIIRHHMDAAGAQEIFMPIVQPRELWEESDRWEKYENKLLLRIKDRHNNDFCLGPTHEEIITDLFRNNARSYRDVPLNLYQIQTKFRDEIRPRFGVLRGREFCMKDAYSFDISREKALTTYQKMFSAYTDIFNAMGLEWRAVNADTGDIGGSHSHEFQVLAETGEDDLLFDPDGDYAVNIEKFDPETAPRPRDELIHKRGIEVGHCFYLGNIYAKPMNALITLESGENVPAEMGCYGIGVSRVIAAAIEQNHDEKGIIWPLALAPYQIGLINLKIADTNCTEQADKLYEQFTAAGWEVLYDDRDTSAGQKFTEMDLLGLPWQCIVSPKSLSNQQAEWKNRKTGHVEHLPLGTFPRQLTNE